MEPTATLPVRNVHFAASVDTHPRHFPPAAALSDEMAISVGQGICGPSHKRISNTTRLRRHLGGHGIALALPVQWDVCPDSESETETDDSDSDVDEKQAARNVVRAMAARRDARCRTLAAWDSVYRMNGSSGSSSIGSSSSNSDVDPAAATCIRQAREAFARHWAWSRQHGGCGGGRAFGPLVAPSAVLGAGSAVPLPRSTATPETVLSTASLSAATKVQRQGRKQTCRRLAALFKKNKKSKKSEKKSESQTAATPTATPLHLLVPAEPVYPAPPQTHHLTLRKDVDQRLGGGVLVHSWTGGRDCYERYPPPL